MQLIFSTADVHQRDRFDFWHSVARKIVIDHDSRPARRDTFNAALRAGRVGGIELIEFSNAPMNVVHTLSHARQAPDDEILLCRQSSGQLVLEQAGRMVSLAAGEMTVLDPRLPYTGDFCSNSELLVVKVPRRQIEARVGPVREIVARPIQPADSVTGLASAFLSMLPAYAEGLPSEARETIEIQVLDLVSLALRRTMGTQTPPESLARSVVRMSVISAIEARLHDPRLDPASVAAAAGISLRYANCALADIGTSILRSIQERRLARCRSALADPAQAHRRISEIAYSWGFNDMTHFGRKFKEAFGLLPSEFRSSQTGATGAEQKM